MIVFFLCVCLPAVLLSLAVSAVLLVRRRTFAAAERRAASPAARAPLRVLFLHSDFGLGGAERLVVDAALALQRHQRVAPAAVVVATSRHDARRAFGETVDGTVAVRRFAAALPAHIGGRAKALCATMRMAWTAVAACAAVPDADCVVVDQVAAALPVLALVAPHTPRLFYCHFPDKRCDANRDAAGNFVRHAAGLRRAHVVYRACFDALEEWSMGFASSIVSNSKFSREETVKTFPKLASVIDPEEDIFYPPVSIPGSYDDGMEHDNGEGEDNGGVGADEREASNHLSNAETETLRNRLKGRTVVLSINRYERKKNLSLAIEAFALCSAQAAPLPGGPLILVMAGGYDESLSENVEHLRELERLASERGLQEDDVLFLKNISDAVKFFLISRCSCVLYTPTQEHFGIVPTEAMVRARPVVAVNSGGPCESVGDGGTLCEPTPEAFASALMTYAADEVLARHTGFAGRRRARELFSIEIFGEKLAKRIVSLQEAATKNFITMCDQKGIREKEEGKKMK